MVSPTPVCSRVLENSDVEIYFSKSNMGGYVKPEFIDRIELEYSKDGQFFNPVSSLPIGNKWPMKLKLIHVGANGQSQTGIYRTVAYCDTVNKYAFPASETIISTKLDYTLTNDNKVELRWNWDNVAEKMLVNVKRKQYMAADWDNVGIPIFKQGQMLFTDTSLSESDTLSYRIDYLNLDIFCQGYSSEITLIYEQKSLPTGIKENKIEKLKIWPNPSRGYLNISYQLIDNQNLSIEIYNSMGQKIKSVAYNEEQLAGNHALSIQLPSDSKDGIYLVQIYSENLLKTALFEYSN